jgi:hypothetical protein
MMNAKQNLAMRRVKPRMAEDQAGFIRGYTKDPSVPKNQRLWSPYNSSWMFANKMQKHPAPSEHAAYVWSKYGKKGYR